MRKLRLLAKLTVLLVLGLTVSAAATRSSASYLPEAGALAARITFLDQAELAELAQYLDIWEVNHAQGWLLAQLYPEEVERLRASGYKVEIDEERTTTLQMAPHLARQFAIEQASGIPGYACYRTVEETYTDLYRLSTTYPSLARWIDIGESWEKVTPGGALGYDLYTLVLTNQSFPGPKPAFFLMGAAHARELTTAETAVRFAEHLVANFNKDADITWLLNEFEVHILAMTNPDGRKMAEQGLPWRKNTDRDDGCNNPEAWGVDLNRNSSFHWGGLGASSWACSHVYRGPSPVSEPEVQALQSYVSALFPDRRGPLITDTAPPETQGIFITLHSYGEMVLWPWGDVNTRAPNSAGLQTLGRKLAYFNGYWASQSINLYPTSGTNDDWAYGELGVAAFTYELGTYFFQDCPSFESQIYPDNLQSLLYAFKSARRPYQTPAGPDVLALTFATNTALESDTNTSVVHPAAQTLSFSARSDDTRYGSTGEPVQSIAAARYSLDRPSWIPGTAIYDLQAADGLFDAFVEMIQGAVNPAGLAAGRHTLLVESRDSAGAWGPPSAAFFYVLDPAAAAVVQGYVRDARTNRPVQGRVQSGPYLTSAGGGAYTLPAPGGSITITATPLSLELGPVTAKNVNAPAGQTTFLDLIAYPTCAPTAPGCIPPLAPQAGFITNGVRTLGTAFQFTDLTVGSHPLEYAWDFGDGAGVANQNSPSYVYTETGAYTITLTVTNSAGTSSFSGMVSVMPEDWAPVETISLSSLGTHKEGDPVVIQVSIQPATVTVPYHYQIEFGDGTPPLAGENSQTSLTFEYIYASVGAYPVKFQAWNAPTSFPAASQLRLSIVRPIYLPLVFKR